MFRHTLLQQIYWSFSVGENNVFKETSRTLHYTPTHKVPATSGREREKVGMRLIFQADVQVKPGGSADLKMRSREVHLK